MQVRRPPNNLIIISLRVHREWERYNNNYHNMFIRTGSARKIVSCVVYYNNIQNITYYLAASFRSDLAGNVPACTPSQSAPSPPPMS